MKLFSRTKPAIKAFSDRLTFGKYKGQSIYEVLDDDPKYVIDLVEKQTCAVADEIYQAAQNYLYADKRIKATTRHMSQWQKPKPPKW